MTNMNGQGQTKDNQSKDDQVQGEGDYNATRRFRQEAEEFTRKKGAEIPKMARDAQRAVDGPEGAELKKAEETGKSKARH